MGRVDIPQYQHACRTLENMIPELSGGAYRRPGSFFEKAFSATQYAAPRIIPFVVSQDEAYSVILTRDFTAAPFTEGTMAILRTTGTAVRGTPSPSTAGFTHPWVGVNSNYYREYEDVQFVQSVDVMTLVHPNYSPMRLKRVGTDTFGLDFFDGGMGGTALMNCRPYRVQNTSSITITPSGTVGAIVLTASAPLFDTKHVGAYFKINHAGTIGCARVTAYTDSTHVAAIVVVNFGATSAQTSWWESSWSDYRGWPRSVALFKGRICYGGNASDRDSVWMSQSENFDVMSVSTITDPRSSPTGSQPFTIEMSSQQLNQIQWLSPDETLIVGTIGQEFVIQPENVGAFGADSCTVSSKTAFGSSYHPAVRFGGELAFCSGSGDAIRSLVFDQLQQTYVSEPIQLFYDHYPKPELSTKRKKFRAFSWDESRKTLWCVDTAGSLFGMTRERHLQVTAWHHHVMGGFDASQVEVINDATDKYKSLCAGSVISVALIPNPSTGLNDIWVCVRRKVNGAYQYHIERIVGRNISAESTTAPNLTGSGNYYVDACAPAINAYLAGTTETHQFGGLGFLDHLEGSTVSGTASQTVDGSGNLGTTGIVTLTPAVVTSGIITMVQPYPTDYETTGYEMVYGLPFNSTVEPVRLEAGSQIGSAQGAIKRIHKLTVRLLKTLSAKVGASADLLETIEFRSGDTPMGSSPDLFTGDKQVDFEGDYDRDGYVSIIQDEPLPFSVVSIIAEGMTSDG